MAEASEALTDCELRTGGHGDLFTAKPQYLEHCLQLEGLGNICWIEA